MGHPDLSTFNAALKIRKFGEWVVDLVSFRCKILQRTEKRARAFKKEG
jgi:hypothetical protein